MFTKKKLIHLIVPLIIEQILAVTVGMTDILMVSGAGEAAVSGISLVDTINILLINILTALATGGAIVSAQYLGNKDNKNACIAGNQLLLITTAIAFLVMIISLIGNNAILRLLFGNIDSEVMNNAKVYFRITAMSYPFLAIYNACAALYRSMGNSKISMFTSLCMNGIHILGNIVFINIFHMIVSGVAISTLIARFIAAIIMLQLIRSKKNAIHIDAKFRLGYNPQMIKRILGIGVPNGLENSVFQIGKILVQGLIASFGTSALAANAAANTIASFEVIPASAVGLALITVVGQCIGAGDIEGAKNYTKKLMKAAYMIMFVLNIIIAFLTPTLIGFYHFSEEATHIAVTLLVYHSICCAIIWPTSFTLPSALRAANDVKFTMVTSILSMWVWRILFSYILAKGFGLGVLGVWMAMTIDWLFRSICFVTRFKRNKWTKLVS